MHDQRTLKELLLKNKRIKKFNIKENIYQDLRQFL